MKVTLSIVGGLILIITTVFSIYFFIDNRYALAQEMKKIEQRLDYKIVSDQAQSKDERIYKIEQRYPDQSKMPATVKEEKDKLQKEKAVLDKKMQILETK